MIVLLEDVEPVIKIGDLLSESLDFLVATVALQQANVMSVEFLLNLLHEHGSMHALITDEEIYQEVLCFEETKETTIADDDEINQEDCSSCCETLNAMATQQKLAMMMDNPVACRLEGILG